MSSILLFMKTLFMKTLFITFCLITLSLFSFGQSSISINQLVFEITNNKAIHNVIQTGTNTTYEYYEELFDERNSDQSKITYNISPCNCRI